MAHFWGGVTGRSETEATRLGTKGSGLRVWANGWDIGAHVSLYHHDGEDRVSVTITKGSESGDRRTFSIGTFTREELDSLIEAQEKVKEMI